MRESERKKRTYIIIGLCAILMIMVVGYAAFATNLKINGTSNITSNWCIGFDTSKTSDYVATPGIVGATTPSATMTYDGATCGDANYKVGANLGAQFKQPGDKVEYTLTIKNASSLGAKIDSILIGQTSVNSNTTFTEGNIKFKVEMPTSTTLSAGATATMKIIMMFQNDTNITGNTMNERQNISVKINASQDDGNGGMRVLPTYECTYNGELVQGAEYVNGQYTYRYMQENLGFSWNNIQEDGWGVMLTDKNSTAPVTSTLCSSINGKPIASMSYMFCSSKTSSIDTSSFNTSRVTDMVAMFSSATNLTTLNLSSFDTSNVTDMTAMFNNCSSLTTLDVSNFNTQNVTNMTAMFYNDSSLTELNLSSFNTSNVTNMGGMFQDTTNLTTLDLSSFDMSNVSTGNTGGMFVNTGATIGYAKTQDDADKFNASPGKPNSLTFTVK